MMAEHLIYSTAIAIIVGMVYYKLRGRDCSCIIRTVYDGNERIRTYIDIFAQKLMEVRL